MQQPRKCVESRKQTTKFAGAARLNNYEEIVRISGVNIIFIAFGDAILFQNCRAVNNRPYGFFRSFSVGADIIRPPNNLQNCSDFQRKSCIIAFGDAILFQNCRAINNRPYGFFRSFSVGADIIRPPNNLQNCSDFRRKSFIIAFGDAILFQNRRAVNNRPYGFFRSFSVGADIIRPPDNLQNYSDFRRKSCIIAFGDTILFQNCRAVNNRPYGFLRTFS